MTTLSSSVCICPPGTNSSLRGAQATKQSMTTLDPFYGLLRYARNDDLIAVISLPGSSSHLHLDHPRSALRDRLRQRRDQFVRGRDRARGNAHALGERDPVERGAVDLEHVERTLPRLAGADAIEFAAQDLIDAIGEYDRGDVEAFAGLRPQRLQRVHGAAVADHADHLAGGARDRS